MLDQARIAYFSMEIGLESDMPTYAGGLGVLAGDTLRSAADAGLPMVAVSLVSRKGYFRQRVDRSGQQSEAAVSWRVEDRLAELQPRVTVAIEGRPVRVRAWRYDVRGIAGRSVPVLLLDTDVEGNAESDRALTDHLYGGDARYRIAQEAILGFGGVRMLRALGYRALERFHMNEGHSSFLTLELLGERTRARGARVATREDVEAIRRQCVFTTHTPVPAGHDQFPLELVRSVAGLPEHLCELEADFCLDGQLNMTYLALVHSHYVNGVAKRHREVSQHMFARYPIDSITNGVHVATWACGPMQELFDRHIPGWREDYSSLRHALALPDAELWAAHARSKGALIEQVNARTGAAMDADAFTLGCARRATAYKRLDLVFSDLEALQRIGQQLGALQVVLAGKAHPRDESGKEQIERIVRAQQRLAGSKVRVAFLEDYDMALARLVTGGVDVWLNTPQPPLEASGTSGMKAAVNGVPSLSVLDGWWVEGCIEGVTGWAIGNAETPPGDHAAALYEKLEKAVLPVYRDNRAQFVRVMRHVIALNASYFNTQRMLGQYVTKAYFG